MAWRSSRTVALAIVITLAVGVATFQSIGASREQDLRPHHVRDSGVAQHDGDHPAAEIALSVRDPQLAPPTRVLDHQGGRAECVRIEGVEYRAIWEGDTRTILFQDGKVMTSGRWLANGAIGRHLTWHDTGLLSSSEEWANGKRQGPAVFYSASGVILASGIYHEGLRVGKWTEYYESGQLMSSGEYEISRGPGGKAREQLRTGSWMFFGSMGEVDETKSGIYDEGKRVSPR